MTPPTTNEGRKPTRAAVAAPPSGPSTCPMVIASCTAATSRRTSDGSDRRPAMMKASVDAAPIAPRISRATKSCGSVWAIAIPMNATPWNTWTRRYWVRGSPRSPTRPHAGLVTTVTSDEIPRIQPAQRSVVAESYGLIDWM